MVRVNCCQREDLPVQVKKRKMSLSDKSWRMVLDRGLSIWSVVGRSGDHGGRDRLRKDR
jgi:hypothetical protein